MNIVIEKSMDNPTKFIFCQTRLNSSRGISLFQLPILVAIVGPSSVELLMLAVLYDSYSMADVSNFILYMQCADISMLYQTYSTADVSSTV